MATRVPNEFITKIQGREFVLLTGLLELAHQDKLKRLETEVLQLPEEANHFLCVVHACVETEKGVFQGTGDASPKSVKEQIRPHLIRMAETRAVARALRFATNVAMTAFEELGELDQEVANTTSSNPLKAPNRRVSAPLPSHLPEAPESRVESPSPNGRATQVQVTAIWNTGHKRGWTDDEIQEFVQKILNVSMTRQDKAQASVVIRELQNLNGKGGRS